MCCEIWRREREKCVVRSGEESATLRNDVVWGALVGGLTVEEVRDDGDDDDDDMMVMMMMIMKMVMMVVMMIMMMMLSWELL